MVEYNQAGEVTKEHWFDHDFVFIPSSVQMSDYRKNKAAASTVDGGMGR